MYTSYHGEKLQGHHVDEILRGYFPDFQYRGVFLDIGAFEPITISNSYHFERNGWDVYCFEANPAGIPLLKAHRKNVYNYAVYDTDKYSTTFNVVVSSGWTAGFSAVELSEDYNRLFPCSNKLITQVQVAQKTMNTILKHELPHLNKIDIVSIDIEGGELKCLQGFDLHIYKPTIVVLENVTNDLRILTHMTEHGYILDKQLDYNQYYKYLNTNSQEA